VPYGRYIVLRLVEVAVPRTLFKEILRDITDAGEAACRMSCAASSAGSPTGLGAPAHKRRADLLGKTSDSGKAISRPPRTGYVVLALVIWPGPAQAHHRHTASEEPKWRYMRCRAS